MAIIGKIRDKGWLVLIVVGLALLAFILTDWSKITGAIESKYGIGTMYGEKADQQEFDEEYRTADDNARANAEAQNQQHQPIDQDQFWKQWIEQKLLEREYELLGLMVSDAEFDAYLYATDGFDPLPDLAQQFTDTATNTFNAKLLQSEIEKIQTEDKERWENVKKYYTDRRLQEKYFDIIGQGIYVTKLEAKNEYKAKNETKNISYVVKRWSEIDDKEMKPSKKELKSYYEKHKGDKKYSNRFASRDIHYFSLPIVASGGDSITFFKEMETIKSELTSAANDSIYVMRKSESKFYTRTAFSTALPKTHRNAQHQYINLKYPYYMDTVFEKSEVGDIVGPYEYEGTHMVAKVLGFTADTLNARHILISAESNEQAEMTRISDSIMNVINDDNFAELVKKYSDDTGSAEKGGDLGDFFFTDMVPTFGNFCATKPIGEIGMVQSNFGIHIVQVTGRKGREYPRLAVVQKTLKPSPETLKEGKSRAYDLLNDINDRIMKKSDPAQRITLFDTLAQREGFLSRPINLKDNDPQFSAFTTKYAEDEILELAFNEIAEIGDICQAPIKDKDKYVIAILASIREKGEPSFEDAKLMMERDLIIEKKTKRFTAMMKGKSMSNIPGVTAQKAEVAFQNPQITGAGFEPGVVGAIFSGLRDGERSKPIEGQTGVFVVKVEKTTKAPTPPNYDEQITSIKNQAKGTLQNDVKKALNKNADVVDNRRLYQLGIRY